MELIKEILDKKIKIAVIGLGYVGLPLSVAITKAGYSVLGIDCDQKWIDTINKGISNIIDVPSEILRTLIDEGKLLAATDYSLIAEAKVIIICVPTPLDEAKTPDLSYIISAVNNLLPYVQEETLISLESTTYPGTTQKLIVERIEREKDWIVGKDFYVCYSPERVDPGNEKFYIENTVKVIGGTTKRCTEIGKTFYESFISKVLEVKSTREAEMTKILESTFRCINIALVNEMAMICERMDIDIWEVIKGASSKPFGFMPFYPGPGVGGHCIPLDPLYLSWEAKKYDYFSRFIEIASDINNNMPSFIVHQSEEILCRNEKAIKNRRILLMGMSYKGDIADLRESPGPKVYELFRERGAIVSFYDPYIDKVRTKHGELERIDLTLENIKAFDLVIILTAHKCIDYEWLLLEAQAIYDTRNVYEGKIDRKLYKLGQRIKDREV